MVHAYGQRLVQVPHTKYEQFSDSTSSGCILEGALAPQNFHVSMKDCQHVCLQHERNTHPGTLIVHMLGLL